MSVVDASVWVAVWLKDDVNHAAGTRWLTGHVASGAPTRVPSLVLPEVCGAVARRTRGSAGGLRAVELIRRTPRVQITPLDVIRAEAAARIAAERSVRGSDSVYAALAQSENDELVTFDQEMLSRLSGVVSTVLPGT